MLNAVRLQNFELSHSGDTELVLCAEATDTNKNIRIAKMARMLRVFKPTRRILAI